MLKKIVRMGLGVIIMGLIVLFVCLGIYVGEYSGNFTDDLTAIGSFVIAGIFALRFFKHIKD